MIGPLAGKLLAMPIELIVLGVTAFVGIGEYFVWYSEILWHKEDTKAKGDARNWGPRR